MREPGEWMAGHIDGAVLIPLGTPDPVTIDDRREQARPRLSTAPTRALAGGEFTDPHPTRALEYA